MANGLDFPIMALRIHHVRDAETESSRETRHTKQVLIELGNKALKDARNSRLERCLNMAKLSDWHFIERNRNCGLSVVIM